MAQQRHMEPAKVRLMGQGFKGFANILKVVSGVLEVQMMILKTTAFIGNVGGLAVERYLGTIKPKFDNLAKMCDELGDDAIKSAQDWENAQKTG
jgi:hypothetical protein